MTKQMIHVAVGKPVLHQHINNAHSYIEIKDKVELYPETDINTLLDELKDIKEEYSDSYKNLNFSYVKNCGCPYTCECNASLILYGTREESDFEYNLRIVKEMEYKAALEKQEIEQLERLQKKYNNE